MNLSSVRSGICRPGGAGELDGVLSTEISLLTELSVENEETRNDFTARCNRTCCGWALLQPRRPLAVQDIRQHQRAMLGEGVGAMRGELQFCKVVAICDHLCFLGFGQQPLRSQFVTSNCSVEPPQVGAYNIWQRLARTLAPPESVLRPSQLFLKIHDLQFKCGTRNSECGIEVRFHISSSRLPALPRNRRFP
jgi:hypothetical protein